jgi:hypothetical protein
MTTRLSFALKRRNALMRPSGSGRASVSDSKRSSPRRSGVHRSRVVTDSFAGSSSMRPGGICAPMRSRMRFTQRGYPTSRSKMLRVRSSRTLNATNSCAVGLRPSSVSSTITGWYERSSRFATVTVYSKGSPAVATCGSARVTFARIPNRALASIAMARRPTARPNTW